MNLKLKQLIACLTLIVTPELWASATDTQTQFLSGVDKDNTVLWDFKLNAGRNSGEWKKIPVPSNWEMQGFGTYRYWNDWQKDPVPDTEGLYRTHFRLPADWNNKQIQIVFGGVMTDTQVTLNDKPIGKIHQGGFYEFRYDISAAVNLTGDNLLEVKVNRYSADESINRAERSADFWLFSGIYRPVWLEAKPLDNIDRVAINAKHTGEFSAEVNLHPTENLANKIVAQLTTLDGKKIGKPIVKTIAADQTTIQLQQKFEKLIPWSAENPQRYRMEFELVANNKTLHSINQIIGFRTVELRKGDGLYVNNVKVRLKGSNRHTIWPTSGRTTSKALSYQDARLMKEMNMNAVRMAHYPPDPHFLEVADEVGLYVMDELTGWQQAYSAQAGEPLVKELIERDHNHPSIIMWANGNEGGWNTELDDDFARWDIQARPVVHPWGLFGGINTAHYEPLNCCPGRFFDGEDVFMPTEFLHALYDGGAGAGLNDWWNKMLANPLNAGGFIWAFADEGIVRDDQNGKIDVAGNRAPDGIVGPYREKEGSFFAIKEIWSPVYFPLSEQEQLPASFNGNLWVENRYEFTNLNQLSYSWKLMRFATPGLADSAVLNQGDFKSPSINPGERGRLQINLPHDWRDADGFYLTAKNPLGEEIYTWSWMIADASHIIARAQANQVADTKAANITEKNDAIELTNKILSVAINKTTGYLQNIKRGDKTLSLQNGPRLVHGKGNLKNIRAYMDKNEAVVSADYEGDLRKVEWRLQTNGWLKLSYAYQLKGGTKADYIGVTFDYPEAQVKSMRWLGKGPYRVWKNRTKGVEYGVWQKDYNDTVTGLSWNYPEFKGFHDHVYWAEINTGELPLTVLINEPNITLRMLTPKQASGDLENPMTTKVEFPAGDISFLHGFTPIGTKFDLAISHGPEGEPNSVPRLGQWYHTEVYFYVGDSQ